MKTKTLLLIILGILFLCVFFFRIFPVPVEDMLGDKDPNNFIYGGLYWISISQQLNFGNYVVGLSLMALFLLPIVSLILLTKPEVKRK